MRWSLEIVCILTLSSLSKSTQRLYKILKFQIKCLIRTACTVCTRGITGYLLWSGGHHPIVSYHVKIQVKWYTEYRTQNSE